MQDKEKVYAIVIYHGTRLHNITLANNNIANVTLYNNPDGLDFSSFSEMQERILKIIFDNDFSLEYQEFFKHRLYNIQFIDILNPSRIDKFLF